MKIDLTRCPICTRQMCIVPSRLMWACSAGHLFSAHDVERLNQILSTIDQTSDSLRALSDLAVEHQYKGEGREMILRATFPVIDFVERPPHVQWPEHWTQEIKLV